MGDAKTYPQLGCYDGGNSEQHALQMCWQKSAYLFVISNTKIPKHSNQHGKLLALDNVKHGDERGG